MRQNVCLYLGFYYNVCKKVIDIELSKIHEIFLFMYSLPKRKYIILSSGVLKTEEGQMRSRGCAKPNIELVQLNGGCEAPLPLPLALLDFEDLALSQVYTFFWWRLYYHVQYYQLQSRGMMNLEASGCQSICVCVYLSSPV